jgi:hypothetical protein
MNAIKQGKALMAGITLLISGCGLTPKHTITAAEAVRRIDAYLRETITSIPAPLNFSHHEIDTDYGSGCTKYPVGDDFTGQVIPSVTYTASTSKINASEAISYVNAVMSYWKGRSSSVETRPDGFALRPHKHYSLVVSYYSEARAIELLGVLDDCIWRYGTPKPGDNP